MGRLGIIVALLALVTAGCDAESGTGGGEKGVWCRNMPAGAAGTQPVRLLVLDGSGSYWVFDGTTPLVFGDHYEMVKEDGDWYWHSWIGDSEYGNRVERLDPGRQLVLWDNVNERPLYYYYHQDFKGAYEYQIQFLEAYGITEDLTCEQL